MTVTQRTTWPNAERIAKHIAGGVLVDGVSVERVGRETAPGDTFRTPCIRIERTGGAINRDFTADFPVIEFAMFGATYDQAQDMSSALATLIEELVGEEVGPEGTTDRVALDGARQDQGPQRPIWGANARRDITRWVLTWRPRII